MEDLGRSPSKAETVAAAVMSLVATTAFGAMCSFLWFGPEPAPAASKFVFGTLFLASIFMLFRAALTSRRALSRSETKVVAWLLIGVGAIAAASGVLSAQNWGRGSLVAASLSCLVYGLAGLSQLRR